MTKLEWDDKHKEFVLRVFPNWMKIAKNLPNIAELMEMSQKHKNTKRVPENMKYLYGMRGENELPILQYPTQSRISRAIYFLRQILFWEMPNRLVKYDPPDCSWVTQMQPDRGKRSRVCWNAGGP